MCLILYFLRLRLYAINGKDVPYRERIHYLWVSIIILTSFTLKSKKGINHSNMLTNCHNIFTDNLAIVFVISGSDVCIPRYLTTETNEHILVGWCGELQEAITM